MALRQIIKNIKQWERHKPSSFWLFSIFLFVLFSSAFDTLFPESPSESYLVIEQIRGGGTEDSGSSTSAAYVPPIRTVTTSSGTNRRNNKIKSSPKQRDFKPGVRISMGGNPGDNGNGNGPSSFEESNTIPQKEDWKKDPEHWNNLKAKLNNKRKENGENTEVEKPKEPEEKVCSILDSLENKAGIDELPGSCSGKYLYKIDTNAGKKELQKVWKDSQAKKETLSKLEKIEKGNLALTDRNEKFLQGFADLKEYKFNKIRIIFKPGKNGSPDQIVAIVKRSRLDDLIKTFKKKYK